MLEVRRIWIGMADCEGHAADVAAPAWKSRAVRFRFLGLTMNAGDAIEAAAPGKFAGCAVDLPVAPVSE
jgi:hypothetical protein